MSKPKPIHERFFTIKTPKKDSSILDQFLDEFGYSAFETEERPDDSRRSVKQVSRNDELIEEVADFCKDYSCSIYLIYKEQGKLMEQLFRGKQICKPKEYGKPDPTPELTENDLAQVQEFLDKRKQNHSNQKSQSNNRNQNKKNHQKRPTKIGVMSDRNYKNVNDSRQDEPSKAQVITKKRRKV
jgi:hypothetical protein